MPVSYQTGRQEGHTRAIRFAKGPRSFYSRHLMEQIELSIIMPVFNERDTVADVIRRVVHEVPFTLELIVIDDGSTDGSGEIIDAFAREDGRIHVFHQQNLGKTAALKRGFE